MFPSSSGMPPPSDDASPSSSTIPPPPPTSESPTTTTKRKRRPAGTPDPDAEVVSLSPRTLLESDRYLCDICGQGFQREQNLQMHRRRHKVPWKLVKRDQGGQEDPPRKRVFVCPEPSCLHHDPRHALGDLVGIKKHYRRKHSDHRQWACARCSKAYAVHSDYKAHLKTCGTRGHSCDCGRVFSRVESFIEHQDSCVNPSRAPAGGGGGSQTTSSPSTASDTNFGAAPVVRMLPPAQTFTQHNLELQLLLAPTTEARLELSIGPSEAAAKPRETLLQAALGDKGVAEEARREAKRKVEQAELELADARRIRQQAKAELERAYASRDKVARQINSILLGITCGDCRQQLRPESAVPPPPSDDLESGRNAKNT